MIGIVDAFPPQRCFPVLFFLKKNVSKIVSLISCCVTSLFHPRCHPPPVRAQSHDQPEYFQRPLDRFLLPMQQGFRAKANMYGEPGSCEERAFVLIEQAKEAPDAGMKRTLLLRAVTALDSRGDGGKAEAVEGDDKVEPVARERMLRVRQMQVCRVLG